ncbi:hypothetical protein Tco_0222576 [Tanacetum coccineum]
MAFNSIRFLSTATTKVQLLYAATTYNTQEQSTISFYKGVGGEWNSGTLLCSDGISTGLHLHQTFATRKIQLLDQKARYEKHVSRNAKTSYRGKRRVMVVQFRRTSLTGFPAQSIRSSNAIALDSPYLLVLITGTSQSRQHESRKSPTKSLFDVGSRRISIITVNTKEYHSDVLAIITRIMRRTY